ncbi:MAG: tetratricopeptide repeat protein [Candidatus Omnitrophota bacterium]
MRCNNTHTSAISLCQKTALIIAGICLGVVFLEAGMRLAGFIFSSLQEGRNRISLQQKSSYRIMCVGESTTAYAIGGESCYPSQLEVVLNQNNKGLRFSVINKGIPDIDTSYVALHLEENIAKYKPDIVVAMLGINDRSRHIVNQRTSEDKIISYLQSLKVYKLLILLREHVMAKKLACRIPSVQEINGFPPISGLSDPRKSYIKRGNYFSYGDSMRGAQDVNKEQAEEYIGLGRGYRDLGDYIQYERLLQKALILRPGYDVIYIELAQLYHSQGRYREAEDALKRALVLNPKNDMAYFLLGRCYIDQGRYFPAEEPLQKAIESGPEDPRPYLELVRIYRDRGKITEIEAY